MNISGIAKRAATYAATNSPAILTAVAVIGTVATAYLTGKASFKAAQILDDQETITIREELEPLTTQEKMKLVWTNFIPPVSLGLCTIACVILANRISARRAAALAAAYVLSERKYDEYKDKVLEKIGLKKEQTLRDELSQDQVNRAPSPSISTITLGDKSVLCFDAYTGRYFPSDMETLRKAMNDINHEINNDYYASLSDFYDRVGLPRTTFSDEVGWNSNKLLELEFTTTLTESSQPCLVVNFGVTPIRDFYKAG